MCLNGSGRNTGFASRDKLMFIRGSARVLVCLGLLLGLSGCVATVVGAAVGATIAVGTAIVTVPVKAGGAIVDAVSDKDKDKDEDDEDK